MAASNPQIDARDENIIGCLRQNARTPLAALARKVGLSRSATQDRLRRLERDGVILGYTLRLRSSSTALQAWLTLVLAPGYSCQDVAPLLLRRRDVLVCHSVAGPTDLLVLVEAGGAEALSALREDIAEIEGVASVLTSPVLADHLR